LAELRLAEVRLVNMGFLKSRFVKRCLRFIMKGWLGM
jgi:hypothetical protein